MTMPLKTTVIGSYPKPPYLDVPSWFNVHEPSVLFSRYGQFKATTESTAGFEQLHHRALTEVLKEQAEIGIDVVTDGELDRESYVWYLCLHTHGLLTIIMPSQRRTSRRPARLDSPSVLVPTVGATRRGRGSTSRGLGRRPPRRRGTQAPSTTTSTTAAHVSVNARGPVAFAWQQNNAPVNVSGSTAAGLQAHLGTPPELSAERDRAFSEAGPGSGPGHDGNPRPSQSRRHLTGISFDDLEKCSYRNGACVSVLPKIVGPIETGDGCAIIVKKWTDAQAVSSKPVKATIPGPFTIIGTTQNKFYSDEKQLSLDLVTAIQNIVKGLADAGCKHIQLDEPVFMRETKQCLDYGIEHASKCIEGLGNDITKTIHLCCGYPKYLDQRDYKKAEPDGYFQIADAIDKAGFDEVSIEDAHCRNDLSLLRHFKTSKIILGSVTIANSNVETVVEIRERLKQALQFISSERLVVAPDCGLAFLPHHIMRQKLSNMVEAAKCLP